MRDDLIFITRDGCVNTPEMLNNLNDALRALGLDLHYPIVDLATLSPSDDRSGYPTPSILVRNWDLFGMAAAVAPLPAAT